MILRLNSNLALQQAKNAVLAAFIIGVLLSVPQIVFSIRQEQNLVNKTIEQALQTLKDSASESAYYVDANLADKVVDGLFQYKSIIKAEITASFGTVAAQRSRRLAFMTREPGSSGYRIICCRKNVKRLKARFSFLILIGIISMRSHSLPRFICRVTNLRCSARNMVS